MSKVYERVLDLEEQIKYYAQKYYEGNPEISDEEFDKLTDELKELHPESEILNKTGWGYEPTIGEKVQHKYQRMGSLNKARTWDAIPEIFKDNGPICISQKLDGLSAVAYYKNGNLYQGVTRGNGEIGIDITDKMKRLVPNYIEGFTGAIRGELIIPTKSWDKMKQENPSLISARNTAAGIINRNEITEELDNVAFCVYKVVGCEGNIPFSNTLEMRQFLMKNFDNVVTTFYPILYNEKFWNTHSEYTFEEMKEKGYAIDGLVLTTNNFNIKENGAIEYTEIAYKFKSETAEAKVIRIDWQLSRTQRLIPTVEIEPTELSGAIIRRASGFNAKYIKDNKIDTNAIIEIERSGEVIPDIQKVIEQAPIFNIPDVCPICGEELKWKGVDLVCTNSNCLNLQIQDLKTWTDILGSVDDLAWITKNKYFEERGINSIESLHNFLKNLDDKQISEYVSITDKKMLSMYDKLQYNKFTLAEVLVSLNIPRLGWMTANKINENKEAYNSIIRLSKEETISGTDVTELTRIVGPATADSIFENSEKLKRINLVNIEEKDFDKLEEKTEVIRTFCVTGKLERMKRADLVKFAEDKGWKSLGGVTKECDYLVTNDPTSGSSKNKKAKELGTKIITENEFYEMLGD